MQPPHNQSIEALDRARDEGLILRPLPDGDMLGFSPPLIVTEADVEEMIARMKRAVDREVDALVAEGAWRPARS